MCTKKSMNLLTNEQKEFWDTLRMPTERSCHNCEYKKKMMLHDPETGTYTEINMLTCSIGGHDDACIMAGLGGYSVTGKCRSYFWDQHPEHVEHIPDLWGWDGETY